MFNPIPEVAVIGTTIFYFVTSINSCYIYILSHKNKLCLFS